MVLDIGTGANDNIPTISANLIWNMMRNRPLSGARASGHRRIVFLAFPRVVLLDLTGPWEVFSLANTLINQDPAPYDLQLVSGANSSTIQTGAGIALESHRAARYCRGPIDTLIVPATDSAWSSDAPQFCSVLQRLARSSCRIVSICGGAFLLAEAGLLDGKKATTHWRGTEELSLRFPEVDVQANAIFVKDGSVYTSAGVTAGIDLALALVEEDLGQAVALDCARNLVMFMRRPGGQSQFSTTLESQHTERDIINEVVAWATDNLGNDLSVQSLSERAHMSLRNFSRVFRNEVGQTPAAFVERLRVDATRQRLEETDESIDEIAKHCGFGSADSMRRSFQRVVKVAPSDYRQRFRRL